MTLILHDGFVIVFALKSGNGSLKKKRQKGIGKEAPKMKWYYYLHINGDIIGRNPIVVDSDPDYFDSPFVRKIFVVETTDRRTLVEMLAECKMLKADARQIKELEEKNNITDKDYECLHRIQAGEPEEKVIAEIFGL